MGKKKVDEDINLEDEKIEINETIEDEHDENEYLLLAQKVQAEFDNYRKRTIESEKTSYEKGYNRAIVELLPLLDTFHSASKNIEKDSAMAKSFEALNAQLMKILSDMGVERIKAKDEKFDANLHNALFAECVEGVEDDIILEELQEGFKRGEKILRHSLVKINKK